jgi:Transglycosylase SLT domain
MGRLIRRRAGCRAGSVAGGIAASGAGNRRPVLRSLAAISAVALLGTGANGPWHLMLPGDGRAPIATTPAGASYRSIILPSLLIVAPKGLTSDQLARLRRIAAIRDVITFAGAEITAGGKPVSVIGVNPSAFRSWVPLRTASDQAFWSALEQGEFVASNAARVKLGLRRGDSYLLRGATSQTVAFGASAALGIAGVDLLVNSSTSRELGLVHRVAALINAPGGSVTTLISEVKRILGPTGKIVDLRPQQLPVAHVASGQLPSSYLQLFKASAADYCPGLSWTVLAAIGQIESADGTNNGPSKAGALGPMQFLPSTWAVWGIDAFGQTGRPDIMNPYDAVASAARMLCADGATAGGSGLRDSVFDYNHADWYVNEVLALAAEYAADYR